MAPLRVSTTKSEWLPDDPTAFVPTRLWKLPFITTWDDSRNQNRPTDSAEEAVSFGTRFGLCKSKVGFWANSSPESRCFMARPSAVETTGSWVHLAVSRLKRGSARLRDRSSLTPQCLPVRGHLSTGWAGTGPIVTTGSISFTLKRDSKGIWP